MTPCGVFESWLDNSYFNQHPKIACHFQVTVNLIMFNVKLLSWENINIRSQLQGKGNSFQI